MFISLFPQANDRYKIPQIIKNIEKNIRTGNIKIERKDIAAKGEKTGRNLNKDESFDEWNIAANAAGPAGPNDKKIASNTNPAKAFINNKIAAIQYSILFII